MPKQITLSKSRVMSGQQCLKLVHFKVHQGRLEKISAKTKAIFQEGHQVGDIAQDIYGKGEGTFIEYDPGLGKAIRDTVELLSKGPDKPIYEATLEYEGVQVRADVLLPSGQGWRMIEVKSSSSLKDEHKRDSAIQAWVFKSLGYQLESISVAHVDTSFVYQGDEDYTGLLVEHDITDDVEALLPFVPGWVDLAWGAVKAEMPEVPVGKHCENPYPCGFYDQCWPSDAEYPVYGLGGSKKDLAAWVNEGLRDIREVPTEGLTPKRRRIHSATVSGEPEVLPGGRKFVESLAYPRYHLDFETISPVVPIWAGTRPRQVLSIQYSCHIEEAPGLFDHKEFLDLSGEPPMRSLAETMIKDLGTEGPILMYTGYEKIRIKEMSAMFPDLASQLEAVIERLVDLKPPTLKNFYHPLMLGSWSIKDVAPVIPGCVDYNEMEGIKEGSGASMGFLEAIKPGIFAKEKKRLDKELRYYCWVDTKNMVELVRFFEGNPPSGLKYE